MDRTDEASTSQIASVEKQVCEAEESYDSGSNDGHGEGKGSLEAGPAAVGDECRDTCLICLGDIEDRSILPACRHSLFCFLCIMQWIDVHRRCPLCSTSIGTYVIHSIRSDSDYVRHSLPSICGVKDASNGTVAGQSIDDPFLSQAEAARRTSLRYQALSRPPSMARRSPTAREARSTGDFRKDAIERWERQLSIRRRVYRQGLYCQHIGSSRHSRLAPPPTPQTIAQTPTLQAHLLQFIGRELIAFPASNIDIDFLTTYALNVFKSLDFKSDESIALLADFLTWQGAQHFCHETYSFARFIAVGAGSYPDKLAAFDGWASYAWPEDLVTERAMKRKRSLGTQDVRVDQSNDETESSTSAQYNEDMHPNAPSDVDHPSTEQSSFNLRADVIGRRAKLLERLEAQRQSSTCVDNTTSLDERERLLKEQLLGQRAKRSL